MTNTPTQSKSSLLDSYEEGKLNEWLTANGKKIIYAILGIIALIAILYRLTTSYSQHQEKDFIQAQQDFATFARSANTEEGQAALDKLASALKSNPELHAAYDGDIAQSLINNFKVNEALPYAQATLKRTEPDNMPFYAEFTKTTLLIAQGQYQQALEKATALQQQMADMLNATASTESSHNDALFAYNLFRIAILQQQIGDTKAELATWQQWKQYAGLSQGQPLPAKIDPRAFRGVVQHMAIGSISLPDYIAKREKELYRR